MKNTLIIFIYIVFLWPVNALADSEMVNHNDEANPISLTIAIDGVAYRIYHLAEQAGLLPNLVGLSNPKNGGTFRLGLTHPGANTVGSWARHYYGLETEFSGTTNVVNLPLSYKYNHIWGEILAADPTAQVTLLGNYNIVMEHVLGVDTVAEEYRSRFSSQTFSREKMKMGEWQMVHEAIDAISAGKDTLIYFLSVDETGHKFGANSPEYLSALITLDYKIGVLLRAISKVNHSVDIAVKTDHGFETGELDKRHGANPLRLEEVSEESTRVFTIYNLVGGVVANGPADSKNTKAEILGFRLGINNLPKSLQVAATQVRRFKKKIPNRWGFINDKLTSHPSSRFRTTELPKIPSDLILPYDRIEDFSGNSCVRLFSN